MGIRQSLTATALVLGISAVIIPVLARASAGSERMMGHDTGRMESGRMVHGMMPGGMMGASMMDGGHGGMMRSMNGSGRPNSQWRARPPSDGARPD